jgi:ComF family protein
MTKPLQRAFNVFQDFVSLIYPRLCLACMANAPVRDEYMCMACQVDLPYTHQHHQLNNTFTDRLWGRFPLHTASSQLLMIKGGITENIIYNIKYKNATALATSLGRSYGRQLSKSALYQDVDLIIPVPIHRSKLKTRGYNQSAMYAEGLAESMKLPMLENALKKLRNTTSQTRKSRMERLINVEGEYAVRNTELLAGKHVLLVDDVMTTGATLESCALEILKVAGTRVSIVTIAMKNY